MPKLTDRLQAAGGTTAARKAEGAPAPAADPSVLAERALPTEAVAVEVDEEALHRLSLDRALLPSGPSGAAGQRALDVRVKVARDGTVGIDAGQKHVATITYPLAKPGDAERLADAFMALPPREITKLGAELSSAIGAALHAESSLARANDEQKVERHDIDAAASRSGTATAVTTFAVAAVSYYTAASAVLGGVLPGLVIGTLLWPVSGTAAVLALFLAGLIGSKVVEARTASLTGGSDVLQAGEEAAGVAQAAREALRSYLQTFGGELQQRANEGGTP